MKFTNNLLNKLFFNIMSIIIKVEKIIKESLQSRKKCIMANYFNKMT